VLVLRPSAPDPLGADVVVATPAVRSQFGARLAAVYAPAVIASFGSGNLRIDIRGVAPDGATAYRSALAADVAARRVAGSQLASNPAVSAPAAARAELTGGRVDPRLLITLAALAAAEPVRIVAFGGSGPGASRGVPLRSAEVVPASAASPAASAADRIVAFLRAQRPPFTPARAAIIRHAGLRVVGIEFAAPSPLGLLQGSRATP
jgi:hypothetical protein